MNANLSPFAALTIVLSISASIASAHQGPDPVAHWTFNHRTVADGTCRARLGPDLTLAKTARIAQDAMGESLGVTDAHVVAGKSQPLQRESDYLPSEALTVSAWLSIDEAEEVGGVVGMVGHATDEAATAWRLGYNDRVLTFSLRTADGSVVEVQGKTPYEKGQWLHAVGVYDGSRLELYINGQLDAASTQAQGPIEYSSAPHYVLGGPAGESSRPLRGKLREVSVYDIAARPEWVEHAFSHMRELVGIQPEPRDDALTMIVEPYLQYGTQDGMTVMWQTTRPGSSTVYYGETAECPQQISGDASQIHEIRIEGLAPETQYFYRVETTDDLDQTLTSDVSTFTTAVRDGTPFAYAIISDTQFNPVVAGRLAKFAWAQRPSFLLHPGDLVDTGVNESHWTQHFFPSMHELISRVPLYPVLGNHEQNARNYFDYMSLPNPEYYYKFRFGNAEFFMIDSNRNVGPGSEQYAWLEHALGESTATWKFACHHHPPYSSDEDDYGELWKTNKSTRGDLRARQLSALYERYGVDIVWNGHIHSYERTWPVRDGHSVADGGPIYMIVGGGGGGLETAGPYRPFFQNQVRHGHHYVMAHVNGNVLEVRSYDLDDKLFDTFTIRKKAE